MKNKFPKIIYFEEGYDLDFFNEKIRDLGLGLKCKEIFLDPNKYDTGTYLTTHIGFVYKGNLKSLQNRNFLNEYKKRYLID